MKSLLVLLTSAISGSRVFNCFDFSQGRIEDTRWPAPHVFLDWDGTILTSEFNFVRALYGSTPTENITLPSIEYVRCTAFIRAALLSSSKALTSISSILEAEFQRNISTARNQFGSIVNTDDEITFQSSALRRNVELQLFARVEQSGMLAYMSRPTLEAAARDISLSDGWWEFADAAMRAQRPPTVRVISPLSQRYPHAGRPRIRLTNQPIQILSATLSIQWVRTALRVSHAAYCASSTANRGSSPETVSICAPAATYGRKNLSEEIRIYCSDTLPTQLVPRSEHDHVQDLYCGGDKVNFMQQQQRRQQPKGTQIPLLYVGNDIADLPPIDYAGIGVLMGGTHKVVKRLKAEGARVEVFEVAKAMREGIEEGEGEGGQGGTVWQVRDFRALRAIFS